MYSVIRWHKCRTLYGVLTTTADRAVDVLAFSWLRTLANHSPTLSYALLLEHLRTAADTMISVAMRITVATAQVGTSKALCAPADR